MFPEISVAGRRSGYCNMPTAVSRGRQCRCLQPLGILELEKPEFFALGLYSRLLTGACTEEMARQVTRLHSCLWTILDCPRACITQPDA